MFEAILSMFMVVLIFLLANKLKAESSFPATPECKCERIEKRQKSTIIRKENE